MVCLIFVTALTLRAIFAMQWGQTPYGQGTVLDSAYFDQQATEISNGHWLPDKVFYVPPVYQYILAVTYKIFGHSLEMVRVLQNLVGSGNCLLIALIAARVFGTNTGLLAGLMAALYRPFIFYDSMVLKTTWDLLFIALFLIYSLKSITNLRIINAALSGIFLGIAVSLRGNMLFLIPCLPLWWLFLAKDGAASGLGTTSGRSWFRANRNQLRQTSAYAMGIALCLLPITASNYFIGHDLVLSGYSSGPNLWLGNNADCRGVLVYPADMKVQAGNMEGEEAYFRSRAEQALGHPLKPSEISSFWIAKAREYVFSHPLDWALLTGKKLLYFWNKQEVSDNYDMDFLRQEFGTVLNGPLLTFGLVAPLAALGIFTTFRGRSREATLLLALSLVYILSTLPFIVVDRYRLPILASFLPFAAHGLMTLAQDAMARDLKHLRGHGLIILAVAILSWAPLVEANIGMDANYTNLGSTYLEQNNLPKAREYFEKAVAEAPDNAATLNNFGGVLFIMGEQEKGMALVRKAITADPSYANAYATLGQMQATLHDWGNAAQSYQQALAINPASAMAYKSLAQVYTAAGNYQAAITNYRRALEIEPNLPEIYDNLGFVYGKLGDPDMARRMAALAKNH